MSIISLPSSFVFSPASTSGDLYTVPSATEAVVSTINVVNTGTTDSTISIAIRKNGASLATNQYIIRSREVLNGATSLYIIKYITYIENLFKSGNRTGFPNIFLGGVLYLGKSPGQSYISGGLITEIFGVRHNILLVRDLINMPSKFPECFLRVT